MSTYVVKKFEFDSDEKEWNTFLNHAKNTTFLFNRNFMDYHKERFIDHSLLIYNDIEKLIACFPANVSDTRAASPENIDIS